MSKTIDTERLTFEGLYNLADCEEISKLEIIRSSSLDKPWLVDILLYSLSDEFPGFTLMSRESVATALNILLNFYDTSWSSFFDISSGKIDLEKIVQYTEQKRYCFTEAANGYRVATINEVNEGLKDLVNEPSIKLDEKELAFINIFTWAITGRWRYYIKAGYKCEFESTGNTLKEPEIKYILKISNVLDRMCELLGTDTYYNNIINKIMHIKKIGEYKYPNYAEDEFLPNESLAFIHNYLTKNIPTNKTPLLYKCSKIMLANKNKSVNKYTVEEKIVLRQGHYELSTGDNKEIEEFKCKDEGVVNENKELCDKVTEGLSNKLLEPTEFVFKVIKTISNSGYRYCSKKQKATLIEAINKMELIRNKRENTKKIECACEKKGISNDELNLAGLSDMLGKGMM